MLYGEVTLLGGGGGHLALGVIGEEVLKCLYLTTVPPLLSLRRCLTSWEILVSAESEPAFSNICSFVWH